MWLSEPLPFIQNFIDDLSEGLHVHNPDIKLSKIQQGWLGFCLMGSNRSGGHEKVRVSALEMV